MVAFLGSSLPDTSTGRDFCFCLLPPPAAAKPYMTATKLPKSEVISFFATRPLIRELSVPHNRSLVPGTGPVLILRSHTFTSEERK